MDFGVFIPGTNYQRMEESYSSKEEFGKMTGKHQAAVMLATAFVGLLTLGIAVPFYLPLLVGRIRKIEDEEALKQKEALVIEKVENVARDQLSRNGDAEKPSASKENRTMVESTEESLVKIRDIQDDFLIHYYSGRKLIKLEENLKNKKYNNREIAQALTLAYQQLTDERTSRLEEEQKLRRSIFIQLDKNQQRNKGDNSHVDVGKKSQAGIKRVRFLKNEKTLIVFQTIGDGSCGMHAVIGKADGRQFKCDAKKSRKEFCEWIEERQKLPERIENVLDDHFCHFKDAPNTFKKGAEDAYKKLRQGYEKLSFEEQDERKKEFRNDKTVLNAYLKNLMEVGTWLLQDELIAFAEFSNVKLTLYQPGWAEDSHVLAQETFNPDAPKSVAVYYDGGSHYERARVLEDS